MASEASNFRRRVCVAIYGEPPRPFATAEFIGAITRAAADLDMRLG
jgi:hypothetical protein